MINTADVGLWRITNKYHERLIHHCRVERNKVHINILNAFFSATVFYITLAKNFWASSQFRDNKKYKSFIATCLSLFFPHLNKSTFHIFLLAQNQNLFSSALSDLSEWIFHPTSHPTPDSSAPQHEPNSQLLVRLVSILSTLYNQATTFQTYF